MNGPRQGRHGRRAVLAGGVAAVAAGTAAAAEVPRRPLRVGQIGTGHGHATKLEVYRRSPDWEVVGLVEPDGARAAADMAAVIRGERAFAFTADHDLAVQETILRASRMPLDR